MSVAEPSTVNVRSGDILAEKYRVDRVLGQGGMGVVVLAEHIELRERVAIKFLLDEAAGNVELAERFIREARAAVRIKSEHVVRVIDVGRLPSGAPYMVMEYLEGQDLAELLAAGPVPIEDAVDYIIQCCEAMHVAHRAGIVHRDLKPANLFLTHRPDGSPLIKILDFGISKVKSPEGAQLSLTHTQAMMGSPLYMSPEQMRSSKDVSASADIWSLGIILHELIAGDVPFMGETFPEVLVKVMGEPPPGLRSLRPEVPEGLEAVVFRCLEKRPADRYSSVAGLAVALTPFASQRTFGLQSRLATSMTDPPVVAVGRAVGATQLTGGMPAAAPIIMPAGATRIALGAPVEALSSKTNTAWDAHTPGAAAAHAGRSRVRTLAVAAGGLLVVTIAAVGLLRGREPAVAGPAASGGAAPAVAVAATPAVASAALTSPRVSVLDAPPTPPTAATTSPPVPAPTAPAATSAADGAATAAGVPSSESAVLPAPTIAAQGAMLAGATPPSETKPPASSDAAAAGPTSASPVAASVRATASTQRPAKAPRARVAARVAASTPAPATPAPATPAPATPAPPAAKPRSKPLSIEFK